VKYPQFADLPEWHTWSDGRKFTPGEAKRFRKLWKRCRLTGEKPRPFFMRVRAVVEAEMTKRTEVA
jgi:hypothetical protein